MPTTAFAPGFIPNLNIQPNIVPRSQASLENADLERQLKLAQLRELNLRPEQEARLFSEHQREFNIGQQHATDVLGEESRYHTGTLGIETDKNAIARESLAATVAAHKQESDTTLAHSLMTNAYQLGVGSDIIADVLKRQRHPELADSFAAKDEQETTAKVGQARAALASGVVKEGDLDPKIRARLNVNPPQDYSQPYQYRLPESVASTHYQAPTAPVVAVPTPTTAPTPYSLPQSRGTRFGSLPIANRPLEPGQDLFQLLTTPRKLPVGYVPNAWALPQ